jgi:hypothetical protein
VHRWWFVFCNPIVGITLTAVRKGRHSVNVPDFLTDTLAVTSVAFVGTLVVNIVRSPKLLDDERAVENANLQSAKQTAEASVKDLMTPKLSALERSKRERVAQSLQQFSADEKRLLNYLLHNGRTEQPRLLEQCRLRADVYGSALHKAQQDDLVRSVPAPREFCAPFFEINPELKQAVEFYLMGDG